MDSESDEEIILSPTIIAKKNDLPWPSFEKYFEYHKAGNNTNIIVKCLLCLPYKKYIAASKSSTANLWKHISRKHPNQSVNIKQTIDNKKNNSATSSKLKQTKLDFGGKSNFKGISKDKFDSQIIKYIINGNHPYTTCDDEDFVELINTLQPNMKIICRQTLTSRISKYFVQMKDILIEKLLEPNYVCTTADCWTAFNRSYIGITVHWIDVEKLERRSAILACQRLQGRHTYDAISKALTAVFKEFHIQNKNICTITDNASNFSKAFRVFSCPSIIMEEDSVSDIEYISIEDIMSSSGLSSYDINDFDYLPKHRRCSCHTLNLVATQDANKLLLNNEGYRKVYNLAISKCQRLWNLQNKSGPSAELILKKLHSQLPYPAITRWGSFYKSLAKILSFLNQVPVEFDSLCDELKLCRFTSDDRDFIKEYCSIMRPVSKAIDILEGEKYMYLGYYTPTITQIIICMADVQVLKYCQPLKDTILASIEKRFNNLYDNDNIIASILHPLFKTDWPWIRQERNKAKKEEILNLINTLIPQSESQTNESCSKPTSLDVVGFFDLKRQNILDNELIENFIKSNNNTFSLYNDFPKLKLLFIKYNVVLTSSAPVERLFSLGKLIFGDKRARLLDNNFEINLLLKANKHLLDSNFYEK
ncbi:uncharacterized protein LOC135924669 [Gordionus sp. m RMFG-2023]|uniref:uncharacterized protein LOC135924669 n=1 Tax=Gordionus sp. m RMFG-2023 TaxID=3053472 RepID=UPI0031FBF79E